MFWLTSTATPVHKGGDRDILCSYSLMSRISAVLKTLEGVLCDQLINHVKANKLVRMERPLADVISFLDELTGGTDKGEGVEVGYSYFQKASYSVSHMLLDQILEAACVGFNVDNWTVQSLMNISLRSRVV